MHDPKFEKEVQQKMEELAFSPSEAVWTKVEYEINKEKRRRAPLLWLFSLLGFLLVTAGGAYLIFTPGTRSRLSETGVRKDILSGRPEGLRPVSQSPDPRPATGMATIPATNSTPAHTGANTTTPDAPGALLPSQPRLSPPTGAHAISATPLTGQEEANMGADPAGKGSHRPGTVKPGEGISKGGEAVGRAKRQQAGVTKDRGQDQPVSIAKNEPGQAIGRQQDEQPPKENGLRSSRVITVDLARIQPPFDGDFASAFPAINGGSPKLTANNLSGGLSGQGNKLAAKKAKPYRAPSWEAGFAGGGGLSSVNQSLFQRASATQDNRAFVNTYAPPSASAASTEGSGSKIQPDFSFWAGIFAQRHILKRLSLSVGLNLHYYSTRVETGQKVATSVASTTVTSSLFYTSAIVPVAQYYPYYPAGNGNTFVNRYYFLELPVSLQWQLNCSRKTPLSWEAGLSVSRLMSSNALYYDGSSGVYYKDKGASSQTQLNATTALLVGLKCLGSRLQLGPQLQYGLTSLLNEKTTGSQHLFYGGIKFTLSH